ncbi:MAG: uric acid transporter [Mycobacterium sp.]|jgi:xanthine/uracil permease|nr:uric acid transporter [Mycobacterium sp.]
MSAPVTSAPKKRVHPVDEVLPLPKLATYGFQHVVAFYAGAVLVLVPIIIAGAINLPQEELVKLITADLFTCGIASIIQAVGFWKVGFGYRCCRASPSRACPRSSRSAWSIAAARRACSTSTAR